MSRISSGILEIDTATHGGLPASDLTVLATSDHRTGSMALGHFLKEGLKAGETTLLISFDRKDSFFENFHCDNFDFRLYHEKGQFLYYNFVPSIRHKVGFLQDYRTLFDEIYRLAGKDQPTRIAIHQADALINLSNTHLIHLTAEKLASACRSRAAQNVTVLTQFVKYKDEAHQSLAIALEKASAGYIELLEETIPNDREKMTLNVRKMPWFDYNSSIKIIPMDRVDILFGRSKSVNTNDAA